MKLRAVTRDLVHIISRYSNWRADNIEDTLLEYNVHANRRSWSKFIDVALLALAVVFCTSGIVFFFAYNWQDLHKFVKLGLVEVILVSLILTAVVSRHNPLIRSLTLTAGSILTGVLFAVFGQIYQTGADAYDLFLGWTVFTILWALVSGFAPLWLILLALCHITLVLYAEQVARGWSAAALYCLLFLVDCAVLLSLSVGEKWSGKRFAPAWFSKTVAVTACTCSTISIISGIFYKYGTAWYTSLAIVSLAYIGALIYSFRTRSVFYLFLIPLSVVLITSAFLLESAKTDLTVMLLIVTAFIVSSITVLVTQILKLNRRWNERSAA